ncbi:hypothetical protein ES703_67999 [subsurface metagenome]
MFFLFPFGFLIPLIFILLAIKIGTRIFREFFHNLDGPERRRPWFPGFQPGSRFPFRNLWPHQPQNMEAYIFRLAYKMKGRVTLSDVVLETGLNLKSAEETMNSMVDNVRVCMEVDERGWVVYEFPEIISRFEGD